MNLLEAKKELREHGYTLLKEGDMLLEDKIENAKKFNQKEYKGIKIPLEGDPKIWKVIIDWMDSVANLSKNNYKFKYDADYDLLEMKIYFKSGIKAFLEATVNKEWYKDDNIHVQAFCNGQVYASPVTLKNAKEKLEIGYKTIKNKIEDIQKNGKNIDVLIDRIENIALDYLSEEGEDFDTMLYSQVETCVTNGDLEDDFRFEFDDGDYPTGDELKEWIIDWMDSRIEMCKEDMDED